MEALRWHALFLKSMLARIPKSEITPCGSGNLRLEKKEALALLFKSEQVSWGLFPPLAGKEALLAGQGGAVLSRVQGGSRAGGRLPNKAGLCFPAFTQVVPHLLPGRQGV